MNAILSLVQKIREHVNNCGLSDKCYKGNPDGWNTLCVSMDTLGDTCEALLNFESEGLGDEPIEGSCGQKYLRLYGFLQAVFLQQDAVRYLMDSLSQPFHKMGVNLDNWNEIRELRNLTVGHPIEKTKNKTIKRCFISRVSLSPWGFKVLIYSATENRDEFKDIDLQNLYSGYKREAVAILGEVVNNLERRGNISDD